MATSYSNENMLVTMFLSLLYCWIFWTYTSNYQPSGITIWRYYSSHWSASHSHLVTDYFVKEVFYENLDIVYEVSFQHFKHTLNVGFAHFVRPFRFIKYWMWRDEWAVACVTSVICKITMWDIWNTLYNVIEMLKKQIGFLKYQTIEDNLHVKLMVRVWMHWISFSLSVL